MASKKLNRFFGYFWVIAILIGLLDGCIRAYQHRHFIVKMLIAHAVLAIVVTALFLVFGIFMRRMNRRA